MNRLATMKMLMGVARLAWRHGLRNMVTLALAGKE